MTEERRLVTILFSDVAGSTGMGEALDPEDMRALLARYFAIAKSAVEGRGGTLEKFIGDAVMAVFGLPTAHEDDAARAAAAALDLRDQVRADPALGDRLPIRLGLSTGEVVAAMGDGGGGDFLVTGDAVNVAARLQQGAASWEIVVSERTARAAGAGFAFSAVTAVEARGRGASVQVRRLEGVAATPSRARTPFLGRDADIAQLDLTAARAFREQRPYLISITAAAGTGKSRLLEEFLDRLPDHAPEARVITAQCLPYGQRLTYLPLLRLLTDLLGMPADADLEAIRTAASAWLTGAGDGSPARTADLLAATFGAGEGDPIDRAELFAAWRSTVELAARQQPLVVVVEDLHWSADSLLDLIEHFLQPRGDSPLLLIVLARPELLDRRPSWGGGRRNAVSIALEPLDDLSISALIDFHLHAPPAEVVEAIVARAGGNPFFAGELSRTIADRAPDLTDPAAVESVMSTLPDTVHAAVLARMDLLPGAARRVVQLGSVFGRSFEPGGVAALEPDIGPDLNEAVDHLLEHDLVRASGADELTFRHILIREVGYQTLPRAERARLHAAAAGWLEAEAAGREDELAELIAFHLREAIVLGTAAGIETDPDVTARAVNWLRRAADSAIAGAAFIEADRHMQAAIEIAPAAELPDLWLSIGDIRGGTAGALEAFGNAARLAREQGLSADVLLRALTGELMVYGRWFGSLGVTNAPDWSTILDEVRAVRPQATNRRTIANSLVAESFVMWLAPATGDLGHIDDDLLAIGTDRATEALTIGREIDDAAVISAALDALGAAVLGRDPEAGIAYANERIALEHRLPIYERTDAYNMLCWCHAELGDLEAVHRSTVKILRDLAPTQAVAWAMSLSAWEMWALALAGRWDELPSAVEAHSRRWEEVGRNSAGWTLHAVMACLEVGLARADDRMTDQMRTMLLAITEQFPVGNLFHALAPFGTDDFDALLTDVVAQPERYFTRSHMVERALSRCLDVGRLPPPETIAQILELGTSGDQRLLLATGRRARGLATGSADDLVGALDAYRSFEARPLVHRVEVELGRVNGDTALEEAGLAGLDALGDVAALARYAGTTSRR